MNRKLTTGAIVGAVTVIAMAISNPPKPAYVDYASEKVIQEMKTSCNNSTSGAQQISVLPFDLCRTGMNVMDVVGRGIVKGVIDQSTSRQNLVLASLYTTNMPGKTFKTVGILGNFVTFYAK